MVDTLGSLLTNYRLSERVTRLTRDGQLEQTTPGPS